MGCKDKISYSILSGSPMVVTLGRAAVLCQELVLVFTLPNPAVLLFFVKFRGETVNLKVICMVSIFSKVLSTG